MQTIRLNTGASIPQVGFGVFQIPDAETEAAVSTALEAGYRSIDTAAIYRNERGVGEAVRKAIKAGLPRAELFVTTKCWNSDQGHDEALAAFDRSLALLGLDYVDLYLIHWPMAGVDRYMDTWRAFESIHASGRAKAIGVSNFQIPHLERILAEGTVVPALNQIELHPQLSQAALRAFHDRHGIVTEAWSPLAQGELLDDPVLARIASKHDRTTAQVALRWQIQLGHVVIPKSVTPARIRSNLALFDFELDADDMATIAAMETGRRVGPDPDTFERR